MKIWMTLMAGKGSLEDLRELWEPIKHLFSGMVCTYHGDSTDKEAKYLEATKGEGKVIYIPYSGRHDHSRNTYLWCGPIEQGDWCCQADTLERPNPTFLSYAFVANKHMLMDKNGRYPNIYYFHSKPFLFCYHESMRYRGSPHEGLVRDDGGFRGIELKEYYPNEADIRENVRPLKRPDSFHFVDHYLKYYVGQPWGSNHVLLGLDKNGDPQKLFPIREARRLAFREYCRTKLGLALTADAIKTYMLEHQKDMPEDFKKFLREEKILNDAWRYHVLGRRDFTDDHDHKNMVEIS